MKQFREVAFCLTVWRAFLVALVAAVLIVVARVDLNGACLIGANVALLFHVRPHPARTNVER